jgi:hypothetical protein
MPKLRDAFFVANSLKLIRGCGKSMSGRDRLGGEKDRAAHQGDGDTDERPK